MGPNGNSRLDVTELTEDLLLVSVPTAGLERTTVELTRAEREVAALASEGMSNLDIAHRRRSSPRTVANQLAASYRKLGVGSRRELRARMGAGKRAP